jgi:hypothetical protein
MKLTCGFRRCGPSRNQDDLQRHPRRPRAEASVAIQVTMMKSGGHAMGRQAIRDDRVPAHEKAENVNLTNPNSMDAQVPL